MVVTVGLVLAVPMAISVGTVAVPVNEVWRIVGFDILGDPTGLDPVHNQIVWEFRTPRVLLAAVTGAGLSVAGVCLQALVRNPRADPYVLGVSSGAALGAVLVLTFGSAALAGASVAAAAFLSALTTLASVFLLAQRSGRLAATRLVLAGVAVSYLATATTSYVQLRANPNELRGIMFWLLGSVAGANWGQLGVPAAVIAVTMVWLIFQGRALNVLITGDESAAALGVGVHRLRLMLLASVPISVSIP